MPIFSVRTGIPPELRRMDKTDLAGLDAESIWNTELAHAQLCSQGRAYSKRTAERRLHEMSMLPAELDVPQLRDELGRPLNALVLNWAIEPARSRRKRVSFAQLAALPGGRPCLHVNDACGARYWWPLAATVTGAIHTALNELQRQIGKPIAVFPHGELVAHPREGSLDPAVTLTLRAYRPVLECALVAQCGRPVRRQLLRNSIW